jgi:hypothetical protein
MYFRIVPAGIPSDALIFGPEPHDFYVPYSLL